MRDPKPQTLNPKFSTLNPKTPNLNQHAGRLPHALLSWQAVDLSSASFSRQFPNVLEDEVERKILSGTFLGGLGFKGLKALYLLEI